MGVWSNFCIVCGGPYRNEFEINDDYNKMFNKFQKKYPSILKHDDGTWNLELNADNWVENIYIVTLNGKLINVTNVDCGEATYNNKIYIATPCNWEDNDKLNGISCHCDCYKFLQDSFSYNLLPTKDCKLKNINLDIDDMTACFDSELYAPMDIFSFGQEFECTSNKLIKYMWLFESPLKHGKNRDRLVKMWEQILNIKKQKS